MKTSVPESLFYTFFYKNQWNFIEAQRSYFFEAFQLIMFLFSIKTSYPLMVKNTPNIIVYC